MRCKLFRNEDLVSRYTVEECFEKFRSTLHSNDFKKIVQKIFDEHNSKSGFTWPAPFTRQKQIVSNEKFELEARINKSRTLEPHRLTVDLIAVGNKNIPLIAITCKFSKKRDSGTKIESYVEDIIPGRINKDHVKMSLPIVISIVLFLLKDIDIPITVDENRIDELIDDDIDVISPNEEISSSSILTKKFVVMITLIGIILLIIAAILLYQTPELQSSSSWPQCIIPYMNTPKNASSIYGLGNPFLSDSDRFKLKYDLRVISDEAHAERDYEKSLTTSSIVLTLIDPNDIASISQLGNAIRDTNKTDTSRVLCSKSIHESPEVRKYIFGKMALAEDHLLLGEFQESIDVITPVIDKCKTEDSTIEVESCANSLIIRGNANYRLTYYDDAEHDYNKSIKTDGEKADSLFGLGNIEYYRDSNFYDASINFKKALVSDPTNTDIIRMYFNSLFYLEEYDELKTAYHTLDPKIAENILNIISPEIISVLMN